MRFLKKGITRCPICLLESSESEVRRGKSVTLEHGPPVSFPNRVRPQQSAPLASLVLIATTLLVSK